MLAGRLIAGQGERRWSADFMSLGRILLVEDDFAIRAVLAQVLMDEGYELICAACGAEAFELLQSPRTRPDAILLDLWMPNMDGLEFRALQSRFPDTAAIPVVVITAGGAREEELHALGLRHVLRKPLYLEALLRTLEHVLVATDGARHLPDGPPFS
jgi:CheY-like chemotaxis protein